MSPRLVVAAPASSANLGPGFDCAAVALELWNELELAAAVEGSPLVTIEGEGAGELPCDEGHLALRAFALLAPLEGLRFSFRNRIPLERGLGSSAASVAAGLIAGAAVAGRELGIDQLLELGTPLEGHADNLAAALRGGACLSWRDGDQICSQRLAAALALEAILVVPPERTNTGRSRSRLPEFLGHEEAAAAAAAAALLGAAIASGDARLLAASFRDRLHEPFRIDDAPVLAELRVRPPEGSCGTTLSGSGPSVVVWASAEASASIVAELARRFPQARVLPLAVAPQGAHLVGGAGAESFTTATERLGAHA